MVFMVKLRNTPVSTTSSSDGDTSSAKARPESQLRNTSLRSVGSQHLNGRGRPLGVKNSPRDPFGDASFEDMARVTLDAISDAVLVVNQCGKVTYINKVAETLTGWSSEEALGHSGEDVFFIVDSATRRRVECPAKQALSQGRATKLTLGQVLICSDGARIAVEQSAKPIFNRLGEIAGAVIVFHDARRSEVVTQKMSHYAQHDFLTGLPNRMLLTERLVHAIGMASRHRKQAALLFLDLDRFKAVNDSFGHGVGDQLLCAVAADIASCVRATDTVSRHSGDEFVILLTEIEERQDAAQIAEKLLAKFAEPRLIDGQQFDITLSIGISVYPEDGMDAETLMQNADIAMYTTKNGGRNSYHFFESAEQSIQHLTELADNSSRLEH